MKTSTLTGRNLDLAVAMCTGTVQQAKDFRGNMKDIVPVDVLDRYFPQPDAWLCASVVHDSISFDLLERVDHYSTYIGSAWPLIERHDIWFEKSNYPDHGAVFAYIGTDHEETGHWAYGATRLEAAMRCLVRKKFGADIDLPLDLNHENE